MIVLRTPKGWSAPAEGRRPQARGLLACTPGAAGGREEESRAPARFSKNWMRAQKPEELFDANGKLIPELKELAPTGTRRMSANPHANGGLLKKALALARLPRLRLKVDKPGTDRSREHPAAGRVPARRHEGEHGSLPRLRPGREHLQQAAGHLRGQQEVLDRGVLSRKTRMAANWPPMAASSRCSASTPWKACSKAICSPAGTASSPPTKRSFT